MEVPKLTIIAALKCLTYDDQNTITRILSNSGYEVIKTSESLILNPNLETSEIHVDLLEFTLELGEPDVIIYGMKKTIVFTRAVDDFLFRLHISKSPSNWIHEYSRANCIQLVYTTAGWSPINLPAHLVKN